MAKTREEDLFANTTMTFGEHLEELRTCLFRALFGLAIGFMFGLLMAKPVVETIKKPLEDALDAYYRQEAVDKIGKKLKDLEKRGYNLPADPDKLKEFLAQENLMPEEVSINPAELLVQLRGTAPEHFRDLPDSDTIDRKSFEKKDLVRIFIWHKMDEDQRTRVKGLNVHEAFMIWIKAAFVAGLILASPWVFYQIWAFVAAGLYGHEKRYIHVFLPFSLGLFLLGAALAFFFVFEPVLNFLFTFNRWLGIEPDPRISEWLSFVLILPLGFGISFQLPLVMLFLDRIGVFSVRVYLEKWRVAILVIFVIGMILTPADPYSMLLMAIPLTFLYFGGILLCKYMPRKSSPYDDEEEETPARPEEPVGRPFPFDWRGILVMLLLVFYFFGWRPWEQAKLQEGVVAEIIKLEGTVDYDYQFDDDGKPIEDAQPPRPEWLRNRLGLDLFADVVRVDLSDTRADDDLLERLQGLGSLERLDVTGTRVTQQGLAEFEKELADCEIVGRGE